MSSWIVIPLINFGIPISVTGLLLKAGLDWRLLEAAFLAVFAIGVVIILLRTIPKLKQLISTPTLQLASSFGNTGYFGIPVALALLPSKALTLSIGYDLGATLLIWSLGPLFLGEGIKNEFRFSPSALIKVLLASPAAKGLIAALIVQLTPWRNEIAMALWGPSKFVIILSLLVVGMRIGSLCSVDRSILIQYNSIVQATLLMKLIAFPMLMLAICLVFHLHSLERYAFVLQAASPTAISVLLISEVNGSDQNIAAVVVILSTLMSLLTVPLWSLALQL